MCKLQIVDDISAEFMTIRLRWSILMLIWIVYPSLISDIFVKLTEENLITTKVTRAILASCVKQLTEEELLELKVFTEIINTENSLYSARIWNFKEPTEGAVPIVVGSLPQ